MNGSEFTKPPLLAAGLVGMLAIVGAGCGDSSLPGFGNPNTPTDPGGSADARGFDCDIGAARASLQGTCAEGLADLLACWAPSGSCRVEFTGGSDFDVIFDNGARLEQMIDTVALSVDGEYLSSSGASCGSFMSAGDFVSGEGRLDFMLAGGQMLSVVQSGDNYDVQCPGGETVTLSDVERDIIDDCAAAGQDRNVCTTPTFDDFDDFDEQDLICRNDSECPTISGVQLRCCGPSIGDGQRTCFAAEACQFL